MVRTVEFIKLEEKILSEIYDLILSPNITSFEREKLLIAKNLLETDKNYLAVLRRLQITFLSRAVANELSPEFRKFYAKLPDYIELESKTEVGFAAQAFLAPPQPL